MAGSSPCVHTNADQRDDQRQGRTVSSMKRREGGARLHRGVQRHGASSSADHAPRPRSSRREKRAGSVTMRTNHSPRPTRCRAARRWRWQFQVSQLSHTCCAPTPRYASWPIPSACHVDRVGCKGHGRGTPALAAATRVISAGQPEIGAQQELLALARSRSGGLAGQGDGCGEIHACVLDAQPVSAPRRCCGASARRWETCRAGARPTPGASRQPPAPPRRRRPRGTTAARGPARRKPAPGTSALAGAGARQTAAQA
jgi:hypothetical protein